MTCPDRIALLISSEEQSGAPFDHAKGCASCQAVLAEEKDMSAALFRVRDPIPPMDFLAGVMSRIDAAVAEQAVSRRQLLAGLAVALSVIGGCVAFFGHELLLRGTVDSLQWLAGARTVVATLYRSLGNAVAAPLLAVQSLALVGFTFLFRRFFLARTERT